MEPKGSFDRSRTAKLHIPIETETVAKYKARLATLFAHPQTHVYVDTSFLMWATKIGTASRRELLTWLRDQLKGRAHVPIWAGHEYLRHHVAGTIVKDLAARSKEVSSLAGKTFGYFRPFLDDPAVSLDEASEELRSSTRNAVNMLGRLVSAAQKWQRSYPVHSAEIIAFINEASLAVGDLYESVASISSEGLARYEGRIPPGFKDSAKKGDGSERDEQGDEQPLPGANRFGDLIFWKEVLADAAQRKAVSVIVLTNDLKNDWRMGGETSPDLDDAMLAVRKSWRPVPRIHPMLALEAHAMGVGDLTLLDNKYLAAYLQDTQAEVKFFSDVAIVSDPPTPPTQTEQRDEVVARRLAEDERTAKEEEAGRAREAESQGYLFPDDPLVKASQASLAKALYESRTPPTDRVQELLARMRANVGSEESVREVITANALSGLDHLALASMARTLHDRANAGEVGYQNALTDLIALLDELPPATAGAMTLGLLASMYLEPETGTSRIPPKSPVARLLLARMTRTEIAPAIKAINRRLLSNDRMPVVVPDTGVEPVEVALDIEPHTMAQDELRSLKINGCELLVAVQSEPTLRLATVLAGEPATRPRLLRRAANLYALPIDRLSLEDEGTVFAITAEVGFRSPATVFRTRETADG